jgi:transposase InsO family protein
MPWKETNAMEQRKEFILAYLQKEEDLKALCTRFGISEKTGHKWKNRFLEQGFVGLQEESRAPKSRPNQLGEDAVIRLIAMRTAHPSWGPKKLRVLYARAYSGEDTPSESSIYRVLGKAGLLEKRRVRQVDSSAATLRRRVEPQASGDVWTVDFKGWWTSGGERCVPLTVRDLKSKYILTIRLMQSSTAESVKAVFEELFRKFGLPKVIRSDNGTPFATTQGYLGLTTLSAWWMSLGILPDRTDPGTPTQNGSHERMHADISREIQGKIPGGIAANQAAIDLWAKEYNEIRPHEAIGMQTPSEVFSQSERPYDALLPIEYPLGFQTRKVNKNGFVKLGNRQFQVSSSLRGLTVGLQPNCQTQYTIWLADFPIAILDTNTACISVPNGLK